MFRKPGFSGTQKSHVCKYQKQSIRNKKNKNKKKQKNKSCCRCKSLLKKKKVV